MPSLKIKMDKELFDQVKEYAEEAGYASTDEFVTHLLEKLVTAKSEKDKETDEDLIKKLQGLGYL